MSKSFLTATIVLSAIAMSTTAAIVGGVKSLAPLKKTTGMIEVISGDGRIWPGSRRPDAESRHTPAVTTWPVHKARTLTGNASKPGKLLVR